MSKLFVYKLTVDNGGAPCVSDDLLTLAICKPSVRSAAQLGDWIFGFGDNKHIGNRLIYIAKVMGKLVNGAYYGARTFWPRPDCIYRWTKTTTLKPKSKPRYHGSSEDTRKDVGLHPEYRRANVLLSTDFRYFGGAGCQVKIPENVENRIHAMTQGHRNLPELRRALMALRQKIWRAYPNHMRLGQPTEPKSQAKCHGGTHGVC